MTENVKYSIKRVVTYMLSPDKGLLLSWIVSFIVGLFLLDPQIWIAINFVGLTFIIFLMLAVAAYLPPVKPLREISVLAARAGDLVRAIFGAALFGAAAAYGGAVGAIMSKMPIEEVMTPETMWAIIWPILAVAIMFGSIVVGVRLGWDFRRSASQSIVVALERLKVGPMRLVGCSDPIFFKWIANLVIIGSRSGAFMFMGYISPVVLLGDIYFIINYFRSFG